MKKIPRGKYKRTKEIREKYSKKKMGKLNPKYLMGKYCKQNEIDDRMERLRKIKLEMLRSKAKRTYLDKEWMVNKYCIEETPIDEIAKLCGVEFEVIWFGLKNLGIPRISIIGREKWYKYVEKTKSLKPFEYADLRTLWRSLI